MQQMRAMTLGKERKNKRKDYFKMSIIMAAVMTVCAAVDIKRKEIPVGLFAVLGIVALLGCILGKTEETEILMLAAGLMPGILLLVLARITEQSIGYGDGIILAEIGLLTGVGRCMLILAAALAMAGIFSIGMLIVRKVTRKHKIPFVPFLTVAYMAVLCVY